MAIAAVFVHDDWRHARTAGFGLVTLDAFDDTAAIGRHDAALVEVRGMIECQVGAFCTLCRAHEQMLDVPLRFTLVRHCGQQQADLEFRVGIEEITCRLEVDVLRQVRVTISAQTLVPFDEFGRFVVLEMT